MSRENILDANILIVDDNEANVLLLEDLLEDQGFTHLRSLTDPLQVLQETKQSLPDLILLDIRMPGMNGFEVMQQLDEAMPNKRPPIIVLTAQTDMETRTKALALGAVEFLNKPFDHQLIIERISNILKTTLGSVRTASDSTYVNAYIADDDIASLKALGYTDETTGLPNRRAIQKHIFEEFALEKDLTAYFIEIDGADALAKTYGYEIYDRAMQTLAKLISESAANQVAMIGAWNANQFIAIKETEIDPAFEEQFARRMHRLLTGIHEIGTLHYKLSVRIGFAVSKGLIKQPGELIRRAVLAVPCLNSGLDYDAYDQQMDDSNNHEAKIESELRRAIINKELYLTYQPKVSISKGSVIGAEALLRWENSNLGKISPELFIPIAERIGMINEIGEWAFDESVKQLNSWLKSGRVGMDFTLAINASPIQLFNPNFISFVQSTLVKHGVSPSQIQIEITESMFISNVDYAISVLNEIRQLGISIAMDDFGTGFSSLSYLQNLPLDTLKIDRCFIDQMTFSEKSRRLVQAIIALAHTFDLVVVAEGIETKEQYRMLVNMGCEEGQGYLFDAPLLPNEFPPQPLVTSANRQYSFS